MKDPFRMLVFAASFLLFTAGRLFADEIRHLYTDTPESGVNSALTANFIITYHPRLTGEGYVRRAARFFEESYRHIFGPLRYQVPGHARENRIQIEIPVSMPSRDLGLAFRAHAGSPPYLLIRNYLDDEKLKGVCSHELFHLVQFGYDDLEDKWLMEATATWVEDEVFPPGPGGSMEVGYPYFIGSWYPSWERRRPLNYFERAAVFPYGTAIYFKYLSEHASEGVDTIRRIWENAGARPGPNSLDAVAQALGGGGQDQPRFLESLAKFSAAVFLKNKSPDYDFRRHREIIESLTPLRLPFSYRHLLRFDEHAGEIVSFDSDTSPLTAQYFSMIIPPDMDRPSTLYLSLVSENNDSRLKFALIEYSAGFPDGKNVEILEWAGSESRIFHKVAGCGMEPADVYQLILVAVQGEAEARGDRFKLRVTLGEPPYLRQVKVFKGAGPDPVYDARWREEGDSRVLEIREDTLVLNDGEDDTVRDLAVKVSFSEKMNQGGSCAVQIAGVSRLLLNQPPLLENAEAVVSSIPIRDEDWERGELALEFTGKDLGNRSLDGNPETPVQINERTLQWNFYEETRRGGDSHIGGRDDRHRIRLEAIPPRVKKVKVFSNAQVYYEGEWRETGDPDLWILDEQRMIQREVDLETVETAELTIEFTGRVRNPRASLGRIEIPLRDVRDGVVYQGTIPLRSLRYRGWNERLPFSIEAEGRGGKTIDGNPETVPHYQKSERRWENDEKGPDRHHKLWIVYRAPEWEIRGILRDHEGKGRGIPGARVFAGVGYYTVERDLFERYQNLTRRMMGAYGKLKEAKSRGRSYRPTEDELEAYDQFERLKPLVREKARFFCGGSPEWVITTDEAGLFRISGMPFPGKEEVIYAFYHLIPFKENYILPGEPWVLRGDYYDVRRSLDDYTLEEDGHLVPTASLFGPRPAPVTIQEGASLTGAQIIPPLQPHTYVSTHLFKQRVDASETSYGTPRKILDNKKNTIGHELTNPVEGYLPVYIYDTTGGGPSGSAMRVYEPKVHFDDFGEDRVPARGGMAGGDFWERCWMKYKKPLDFLEGTEKVKREEEVQRIRQTAAAHTRETLIRQKEMLTQNITRMEQRFSQARTSKELEALRQALQNMRKALKQTEEKLTVC